MERLNMRYNIRYTWFVKFITILLLIAVSGCVSSKIEYVEAEKVPPKDKTYRIAEVFMKDGTKIDLRDAEPKFRISYIGKPNVITYYDEDYNTKVIQLKDASQVKIEILDSNQILTGVLILGITITVLVLAFFLALGLGGWSMH